MHGEIISTLQLNAIQMESLARVMTSYEGCNGEAQAVSGILFEKAREIVTLLGSLEMALYAPKNARV
ncbi:MAG: hypothetical protein LBH85_01200 [Treponema sp.]|jgi:hypothetical protein|nr:hypothetical protein [Treponema sp.]